MLCSSIPTLNNSMDSSGRSVVYDHLQQSMYFSPPFCTWATPRITSDIHPFFLSCNENWSNCLSPQDPTCHPMVIMEAFFCLVLDTCTSWLQGRDDCLVTLVSLSLRPWYKILLPLLLRAILTSESNRELAQNCNHGKYPSNLKKKPRII